MLDLWALHEIHWAHLFWPGHSIIVIIELCICSVILQVSDKFAFSLFDLDWDVFMQHIDGAVNRVPALEQTGIKSTVCGPGT